MIFVPIMIVVLITIIITPTSSGRCRKHKGFFTMLMEEQRKTEKRNNSHRGVMCGPGGSKRRK